MGVELTDAREQNKFLLDLTKPNLKPGDVQCKYIQVEDLQCDIRIPHKPDQKWVIIHTLADKGANGTIFIGHPEGNSQDIKIVKQISGSAITGPRVHAEICLQNIAAHAEIAPRVYDYWYCNDELTTAMIVMDKAGNITFGKYLNDSEMILNNPTYDINVKLNRLYNIFLCYEFIYIKMWVLNNEHKIIHGDLHVNNIMIQTVDDKVTDIYFIDFGLSEYMEYIIRESEQKLKEYHASIDPRKLINVYSENYNQVTKIQKDIYVLEANTQNGFKVLSEFIYTELFGLIVRMENKTDNLNSAFLYYLYKYICDDLSQRHMNHFDITAVDICESFRYANSQILNMICELFVNDNIIKGYVRKGAKAGPHAGQTTVIVGDPTATNVVGTISNFVDANSDAITTKFTEILQNYYKKYLKIDCIE